MTDAELLAELAALLERLDPVPASVTAAALLAGAALAEGAVRPHGTARDR